VTTASHLNIIPACDRQTDRKCIATLPLRVFHYGDVSRQYSAECIPLPNHTEISIVSLPQSSRCIGLYFPATCCAGFFPTSLSINMTQYSACFKLLKNLIDSCRVHPLPTAQISSISTQNFPSYPASK